MASPWSLTGDYRRRIVDDELDELMMLDPVPGWTPSLNHLRDLTQAPKHYLADPALGQRL